MGRLVLHLVRHRAAGVVAALGGRRQERMRRRSLALVALAIRPVVQARMVGRVRLALRERHRVAGRVARMPTTRPIALAGRAPAVKRKWTGYQPDRS